LLKETKSTVFKALRAAVSGGQFLRWERNDGCRCYYHVNGEMSYSDQ
jgi:hypothetical protein